MVTLATMFSLRARIFGWLLLTSNFNIPTMYENTQNSKNLSGKTVMNIALSAPKKHRYFQI